MRVVTALGGNALIRRGEAPEWEIQRGNARTAAAAIAELAQEHSIVVTHGNGPQVGLLALQAEAYTKVRVYPLDALVAESEGMIGYLIDQELKALLPGQDVATLLTQVEVDRADPAFETPSKPIGPIYTKKEAEHHAAERGWALIADGDGFRRSVPSPEPRRIIELRTIRLLLDESVLVICTGGGGIPVARSTSGALQGVEAVVDKDLSASLLACQLQADALLLLTDVPAVWLDWPEPAEHAIRSAGVQTLRGLEFEAGSMEPKIEAACRFVETTGCIAGIGALGDALRVLRGKVGTQIRPGDAPIVYY